MGRPSRDIPGGGKSGGPSKWGGWIQRARRFYGSPGKRNWNYVEALVEGGFKGEESPTRPTKFCSLRRESFSAVK